MSEPTPAPTATTTTDEETVLLTLRWRCTDPCDLPSTVVEVPAAEVVGLDEAERDSVARRYREEHAG